ncbi:MAG: antibiotic biosynthesis monooxygenase [Deltaproteobacteria bacterium]|nr:antibiotic biosynthesis monooxygenase [Deltaproteobacteria bacterium]
MLVIAGEIAIDPARRAAAIATVLRMAEETRKEAGCAQYVFSGDLGDPGRFRIFEEWESQAALDAHFASPHMAAFQTAIAELGVRSMTIRRYEVSSVGPLR